MNDTVVNEGDNAIFKCQASGSPKPKFNWFLNGTKLEFNDRHFLAASDEVLIVWKTRIEDAGL